MNAIEEAKKIAMLLNTKDHKLWDILSALRGPDSRNYRAKLATTAVIRHAIGMTNADDLDINPDSETHMRFRLDNDTSSHFWSHARTAFWALGLKWDEVNK